MSHPSKDTMPLPDEEPCETGQSNQHVNEDEHS